MAKKKRSKRIEFPKKLVIEITKNDSRNGVGGSCSHCPTALAAERHFPGYSIGVVGEAVEIRGDDLLAIYRTPTILRKRISSFDEAFERGTLNEVEKAASRIVGKYGLTLDEQRSYPDIEQCD